MPISYLIDSPNRLVSCSVSGTVTIEEVQAHRDQLHRDPAFTFQETAGILWDFSATTHFDHSMAKAAPLAESWLHSPKVRRALVSKPRTEIRKFLSLWVLHRATRRDLHVRNFDNVALAQHWLAEPR
jgi:hypothetical protein